jgi:hypothetical protein
MTTLPYLKESASQTAGPYVHIGLAPGAAGFKIFERELGWDIAGPAPGASASASRARSPMAPAVRSRTRSSRSRRRMLLRRRARAA